jgi:uncharacterized OsmC-like protein
VNRSDRYSLFVYNSQYVGGELVIETTPDPFKGGVEISYRLNGEEISREEAQRMLDAAGERYPR